MLDSIIKKAEDLGNQIAGSQQSSTTGGKPSNKNAKKDGSAISFFKLKPFKDNEFNVSHRENLLRNISSIKGDIHFIIQGNTKKIELYIGIPKSYRRHFQNMFYATYKTSELVACEKNVIPQDANYFHYKDKTVFASRNTFSKDGSYIDPFKELLSVYNTVDEQSSLQIFFTLSYSVNKGFWTKILDRFGSMLARAFFKKKEENKEEEKKKTEASDQTDIFVKMGYTFTTANPDMKDVIKSNMTGLMGIFCEKGGVSTKYNTPKTHKMDRSQMTNFFHVPTKVNYIQQLDYSVYRKLPAPTNIGTAQNTSTAKLTKVGKTDYRGDQTIFGIREEDKFRHMYIIGKTGVGKSNFLSNLIKDDIDAGKGVGLLDPHGELVDTILEHIPSHRINDVILFDVSDDEYPVGFNLLSHKSEDEKLRVVSGVVTTFKKLFGHSWGPRLEYILRNVLLSIVDYPNATILHIMRMLTDKAFREEVLKFVKDNLLLKFWREEFDQWNPKQIQDAIGPITNKIGQFLSSSVVRNIFGQPRAKLNMREAMDAGKIVLINLSKGKIGADNASMIGSLLVTKFQIDAMSRADIKADERTPFYLYIDEFQNFATDSFAEILSEARKYKLSIIVANQYSSQLLPEIRDAIFGNIGTIISFTLGYDDAKIISNQFKEMVSINDLISLPKFTCYTRMMIDGVTSDPFSIKTLKLPDAHAAEKTIQKVTEQSRQRYAMEKNELEALIAARAKKNFSPQEKIAERSKLEGLGISDEEIDNLDNQEIKKRMQLFLDYKIDNEEPDAILFDIEKGEHKAMWYKKPEGFEKIAEENEQKIVTTYKHKNRKNERHNLLSIWVGSLTQIQQQIKNEYTNKNKRKFVRNIEKIKKSAPIQVALPGTRIGHTPAEPNLQKNTPGKIPQAFQANTFGIKDVTIGKQYEGYVKLIYNYGIFITVKGVEGLLHKNYILDPGPGIAWKKFYNIGDKIKAYASSFKEINGEKKVVRSQYTTEETKRIDQNMKKK